MLERDVGWIQVYASSNQEVYDLIFQCFKLAESKNVQLPVMLCMDGFLISHTATPVELIDQKTVEEFLPEYPYSNLNHTFIDVNNPLTYGNVVSPITHGKSYYRYRYLIHKAMLNAAPEFKTIQKKFEDLTGRNHGELLATYKIYDSEIVLISMGTLFNQSINAVDALRREGYKIGSIKVRFLRPFPNKTLQKLCKGKKAVLVLDRSLSPGVGGILAWEVKSSLFELNENLILIPAVAGLGGLEVTTNDIINFVRTVCKELENKKRRNRLYWIGF
jgi:pyruvate/2-oxoacid:ferredoxin oxidoreductase alpha subunit